MKTIYFSHPYGGRLEMLDNAERLLTALLTRYRAIFVAPWIPMCRQLAETPENRKLCLQISYEAVTCFDWLLTFCPDNNDMSSGQENERHIASSSGMICHGIYSANKDIPWNELDAQLLPLGIELR